MDTVLLNALHGLSGVSVTLDWLTVVAARYLPWGMALAAIALAFKDSSRVKRLENLIFMVLAVLVSRGFVTEIIRYFAKRDRPFVALGFEPLIERSLTYALPSGHAAILFALAVAVWSINRKWGYWFGGLALVNGAARVIAGVHWPTDILTGALVGIVVALFVRWLLMRIPKRVSA